jgi:DNA-binding PucR family transcriptional regulator
LRAYFRCGRNAASAAHILGVDRRTVWYRLRAIEACLGYTIEQRLPELELALRIENLQQGAVAHEGCRLSCYDRLWLGQVSDR